MLYYTVTCKSSTSLQMELLLIWLLYFVLTNARIHSSSSFCVPKSQCHDFYRKKGKVCWFPGPPLTLILDRKSIILRLDSANALPKAIQSKSTSYHLVSLLPGVLTFFFIFFGNIFFSNSSKAHSIALSLLLVFGHFYMNLSSFLHHRCLYTMATTVFVFSFTGFWDFTEFFPLRFILGL